MNAAIFYNNPDPRSYVSLVPTSAHTGDGMGDLIAQVVRLTQTRLSQRLSFSEELQSMVLEVRRVVISLFTISTEFRKIERERAKRKYQNMKRIFLQASDPWLSFNWSSIHTKPSNVAKMVLLLDATCETVVRPSGRHVASETMPCIPVKRVFDSFMCFISYGMY